jgi:hypothetical protein
MRLTKWLRVKSYDISYYTFYSDYRCYVFYPVWSRERKTTFFGGTRSNRYHDAAVARECNAHALMAAL